MRRLLIVLSMLLFPLGAAHAEVSVSAGFSSPGISIGINLPAYPRLVLIPGYPVYYGSRLDWNYFFYDGMYWVYYEDDWYASSWYNGPWFLVERDEVPLYVLRIPVRYYRNPPPYFFGWIAVEPPRWGEHWGRDWDDRHHGWDRWDHHAAPPAAPLPSYQRQYSGKRYPHDRERQQSIHSERYRHQPGERVMQQHNQQQRRNGDWQEGRGNAERGQGREERRRKEGQGREERNREH